MEKFEFVDYTIDRFYADTYVDLDFREAINNFKTVRWEWSSIRQDLILAARSKVSIESKKHFPDFSNPDNCSSLGIDSYVSYLEQLSQFMKRIESFVLFADLCEEKGILLI